jgi:NADPH2:quinone reductase
MHAMLLNENRDFVWSEVPDPVRKEDEVMIEVHAAGVNRADLLQREGNYPSPPGWPKWPGLEVAGTVAEAPEVSRWKSGDRVCALLGGGGYAEKAAVPEGMVLPVPEGLFMTEAASIPEVWSTAYLNFVIEAKIKAGDTVFIQAGASGLGLAAIQLAKSFRCKVIATVGSDEKAAFVKALGADVAINRKTEDIGKVLDENPVDIALDCVSGPKMGEHVAKMAPWGRWIVIAALAGAKTELDLDTIYRKRIRVIGSTLRSRTSEMKTEILKSLESELWSKFSSRRIRSVIYKTLPIRQVEEAHAILKRNENTGKVVLTLKGE